MIPFVSPVSRTDPVSELTALFRLGARGVKLHPAKQGLRLTEPFVERIARWAAQNRVPVMVHAGGSPELFGGNTRVFQEPADFARLAAEVPDCRIVIAHVGLWEYPEILRIAPPHPNLFVDVSFQSTGVIRQAVQALGSHRVLLGSDHPFGNIAIVLRNLSRAGLAPEQLSAIHSGNAQRLLSGM